MTISPTASDFFPLMNCCLTLFFFAFSSLSYSQPFCQLLIICLTVFGDFYDKPLRKRLFPIALKVFSWPNADIKKNPRMLVVKLHIFMAKMFSLFSCSSRRSLTPSGEGPLLILTKKFVCFLIFVINFFGFVIRKLKKKS